MIQSMTGFATKTFILTTPSGTKSNVTISLKTLNSRFFEANCRLPYVLSHLETRLIALFKKKLVRGNVYCTIHLSNPEAFNGDVHVEMGILSRYVNAIKEIKKEYSIQQDLLLDHIIRLPNIFTVEERTIDEQSAEIIVDTIDELINNVTAARIKEGQELKKDLITRIAIMDDQITKIEQLSSHLVKEQKERVQIAIQEIKEDASDSAEGRRNSMYAALDKMDIHEEIVRFKSHLINLKELLDSPALENGKRIDFTLQELAREINTAAAKCSDATLGTYAINIKVEIEKTREQIQNII